MTNVQLITHFYQSFANNDIEAMVACYDDKIAFEDPAFGHLKGNDVKNMWRMLSESSNGILNITFENVKENGAIVSAHWQAVYVFSATGRLVTNTIKANFVCENGKIIQHTDSFSLWKWSQHSLGFLGYAIGYTKFFKKRLQKKTRKLLQKYTDHRNE